MAPSCFLPTVVTTVVATVVVATLLDSGGSLVNSGEFIGDFGDDLAITGWVEL
jgi:hypothetical protein